jgi:hypothetical protein
MHPPRLLEEEPKLDRNRLALADHVLEHAHPGAARMHSLRHLRELERIAEQNEPGRRGPARERIRKAELSRLVHDERVQLTVQLLA